MKNAHLRLAQVEYSVQSKNWSTRVQVWCDRLATEDSTTHMLSLFGNDSEMAAVSGAISINSRLTAKLPDGSRLELFMGEKPTTYRGHLSIPGRLRPVRHILCFSEALMQNGTAGSVTVLHNDDTSGSNRQKHREWSGYLQRKAEGEQWDSDQRLPKTECRANQRSSKQDEQNEQGSNVDCRLRNKGNRLQTEPS